MSLATRALLPIALVQLAVPVLPLLGLGQSIAGEGEPALLRAPEGPPGVFFAIWGVIFTGYLGVGIWAWRADSHVLRRVAPPLAVAGLLSVVWMLLRQGALSPLAAHFVLVGMFIAAFLAARRFDAGRGLGGSPGKWVTDLTTGLLAGWMSLALALSTTALVRRLLGLSNTDMPWQMLGLTLAIAGAAALFAFARITRSPYFVIALAWGLAGVVINLWWLAQLHVPAVLTAAFGLYILYRRLRFGAQGARPAQA